MNNINGLVEMPDGTAWAFGPAGIVRFRVADLERAFRSPKLSVPTRTFDYRDGLRVPGTVEQVQTVAAGSDGRVWFASDSIVMVVDAHRLAANNVPPGVKITALDADGKRTHDPTSASVPAGTSDLRLAFSALSLTKPQKVQVRYRLEGADKAWIDPGLRREAFYTNLAPGTYRFHVIAANDDGVWNREGATLEFTIPPTFLQSIWFKLLIGLVAILVATLAYRLRVRQVTARLQSRFDARIAERERIARELHDTLLQGFQGLTMRFQAVADRVPERGGVRDQLEEALDQAETALVDGRARVRDLRRPSIERDLAEALREAGGEVTIEGTPRPLHPLVREEVLAIGEEAIRNAAQHARASRILVALRYGQRTFELVVRDDGIGLPEPVLATGQREGHFGLVGMRERAARIEARLALTSVPGNGTAVTFTLPERAAYADSRRRWFGMQL